MSTHFKYPEQKLRQELRRIAIVLTTTGKGILAADETKDVMERRFENLSIENTENTRRKYRQMIFSTEPYLNEYISGVILSDETFYQHTDNGTPFVKMLRDAGVVPGIKVDKDLVPLMGSENEFTTQGLDQLGERCKKYKKAGCDFAKWRCVFRISDHTPSYHAMQENCNVLARFASICQMNGMVPVIQPEVLPEGDHDLEQAQKTTEKVLAFLYKALSDHHIYLEGTLLMANMVKPGVKCLHRYAHSQVAKATVQCMYRTVPPAVQGIVFLSGGQCEEDATVYLDSINKSRAARKPWVLSFAYGRALQNSAIKAWDGKEDNARVAQMEFLKRAKALGSAAQGMYERGTCRGCADREAFSK